MSSLLGATAVDDLRGRLRGELVTPTDPGYEDARQVHNGMIDRRPSAIVRCAGTDDVVTAVRYARSHQLPIAVRGGGHSVPGYGVSDGGIVIDLRLMSAIVVSASDRTAVVQGGAVWGELDAATQAHGLAVPGGRVTTTTSATRAGSGCARPTASATSASST